VLEALQLAERGVDASFGKEYIGKEFFVFFCYFFFSYTIKISEDLQKLT